jgi:preprotein translocase subunit SecA
MNSQREVVYKKRKHALFGDRLALDLTNMMYDLSEEVIVTNQEIKDYENFKLDVIRYFATDTAIDENEFLNRQPAQLADQLFNEIRESYKRKTEKMAAVAFPVLNQLYQTKGDTITNVAIPFSDGKKTLNVVSNLEKDIQSGGKEIIRSFEKNISLGIIDEAWKEHLREMDELKQSVQNAVFEQKDPLLIYKLEAYELFKRMVADINKEVTAFLFKANVPFRENAEVKAAREPERTDMSRMKVGRDNDNPLVNPGGSPSGGNGHRQTEQEPERKLEPIRVEKKVGRNEPCPCGSGQKYKNCHGKDE